MASASQYWTFVQINPSGGHITREIPPVNIFFQQQFPELTCSDTLDTKQDRLIQRQLVELLKDALAESVSRLRAEGCLRCYVSHQILYVCTDLASKFGSRHGFTPDDLLGFVLDDVDPNQPFFNSAQPGSYRPFSIQILQTFDPLESSLSTWSTMLTRRHDELNDSLLKRGVLLQSDWAILNDKEPDDLHRILTNTYHLPETEIEQACILLSSYHLVYRNSRRKQRKRGRCLPPTEEQLDAIKQMTKLSLSLNEVMAKLLEIADYLRQHHILSKVGVIDLEPIEDPEVGRQIEQGQILDGEFDDEELDEQRAWLQRCYEELIQCLDQAIERAIEQRHSYLQRRSPGKATKYIPALESYWCYQKTMSEIATEVGLKAQYEVTRLLKIDDFLANIRRQLLKELQDTIIALMQEEEFTQRCLCPDCLQNLEKQLDLLIIKQRPSSSTNSFPNRLFLQRLCYVIQQFQ